MPPERRSTTGTVPYGTVLDQYWILGSVYSTNWSVRCGRDQQRFQFEFGPVASHTVAHTVNSCVLITSPITVKKKLVVSPAINQVVQSLSARLLRVGYFVPPSYGLLTSLYPWDSAAVSIVFMGAAPARATPSPTSRRGSLYAPSHAPDMVIP